MRCESIRSAAEDGNLNPADGKHWSHRFLAANRFIPRRHGLGAVWGDYDNDGDGTLVDVTQSSGADLNNDGWVDPYVANDVTKNAMYLTRGCTEGKGIR